MNRTSTLIACIVLVGGVASAGTIELSIFGTGFETDSSTQAPTSGAGDLDGNFLLIQVPTGPITPVAPYITKGSYANPIAFPFNTGADSAHWLLDVAGAGHPQWVSPSKSYTSTTGDLPGLYIYQETFDIPADVDLSTVVITGEWTADNYGEIYVDGNADSSGEIPNSAGEFATLHSFTLDSATGATFTSGENTLDFYVYNTGTARNATGLYVDITSATVLTPEPASFALLGGGLLALAFFARKRRRKSVA